MSSFFKVSTSAAVSPALYQCQLSSRKPRLGFRTSAINSFISAMVWMNGYFPRVHPVFGATYSRPSDTPQSPSAVAASPILRACRRKVWRYVSLLSDEESQVTMRLMRARWRVFAVPARSFRNVAYVSSGCPTGKDWAYEPNTSFLDCSSPSNSLIAESGNAASSFRLGSTASNPNLAAMAIDSARLARTPMFPVFRQIFIFVATAADAPRE